jgi:hypothetical protein
MEMQKEMICNSCGLKIKKDNYLYNRGYLRKNMCYKCESNRVLKARHTNAGIDELKKKRKRYRELSKLFDEMIKDRGE